MGRVFILGAGFSKAAGMPLATELLEPIARRLELAEMEGWLTRLSERLAWLQDAAVDSPFKMNIEQVFHFAHFDAETHKLLQHLEPVGRHDGPGTAWHQAHAIDAWLSYLERELRDVIVDSQSRADTRSVDRWAASITDSDAILTFNYDILVEQSLSKHGKKWNHGTTADEQQGYCVCKLHGSIDWVVAHREQPITIFDLIFDKVNENRGDDRTGHIEDDYVLRRCRDVGQLRDWMNGRHGQLLPVGAASASVGIAGLGTYKPLHYIPGLGIVWKRGMQALYEADSAIVIGFSMSDFDAMAQPHFGDVARARHSEGRPLPVTVVDPFLGEEGRARFQRVFRTVEFVDKPHEEVDWSRF
jgi:hypothetical protein